MKRERFDPCLILLSLLILVYALLFSWISFAKFESFSSYSPQDLAAHSQAIWNTAHGRFLQQSILYRGGLNHFYPLLALFAPLYCLTHHIFPLLFLYSLILALGALPVYLLSRNLLDSRPWALLIGSCYLIYPGLHILNLTDLKPIVLTAPLLLFTFYFWQAKSLLGFVAFALLTSLATEQVAPLLMMFAPLSWIKRRGLWWILAPLLIGLGILLFSIHVYVPWASGAPYKHIKDHRILSRMNLFSWASHKHVFSFLGLAAPLLLLSWEGFILAIPYLVFGIVATRIYVHYYYPLTAIFFISWIYGLRRIQEWKSLRSAPFSAKGMILVSTLALVGLFLFDPLLARPQYAYRKDASDYHAWSLIRRIPEGASVTSDPTLLPALSFRERLHEFSRKEYHGPRIKDLDVDYVLIDPKGPHRPNPHHHHDYPAKAQRLLEETQKGRSGFEIVAREGDWVLFQRKNRP
ncbi:MAG: DUF2079 domain-containing protein [candidate division NC10 bacterium]|nr:DUF2079 domain-containing protein [candidate division NC10 bacterium]